MTLAELLVTLQNADKIVVNVKESDGSNLITFYANGYAQVLGSVLAREVDKLTVNNGKIDVVLKGGLSA